MGRHPTCDCGDCKNCKQREYMREWYRRPGVAERVRALSLASRQRRIEKARAYDRERGYRATEEQRLAHSYARTVPLEPCSVCGSDKNIEKHHPDYSKPREIVFLCRTHHHELHRKVA